MKRPWTTGEQRRLIQLYADGVPVATIAALFGRTVSAITDKAHRLGCVHKRRTASRVAA